MNMDFIVGSYFNGLRRCRRDGSRDNLISIIRCKLLATIASVNSGEVYVLKTPRDTYVLSYMTFGVFRSVFYIFFQSIFVFKYFRGRLICQCII